MTESRTLETAGIAQAQVPRVYARIAPFYDRWGRLTESRARRRCLEQAALRDGEDVLEVAVGTGLAFEALVRANPHGRTEGIDLTEAMLARARVKVAALPGRHRLRVGDAHHLDFADASFDLVVNHYMFDLLPEADFAPVLREFHRVLRPGGRLALVNMATSDALATRLWTALYRVDPALLGGCRGVALAPWVTAAGFRDLTRETVRQLTFPSEVLTARK